MSNLPEQIVPGSVSELQFNIASHLDNGNGNEFASDSVFNGVEGFAPLSNDGNGVNPTVPGGISNEGVVNVGNFEGVGNGAQNMGDQVTGNSAMQTDVGGSGSLLRTDVHGLLSHSAGVLDGSIEDGFTGGNAEGLAENNSSRVRGRDMVNGFMDETADGFAGNNRRRVRARITTNSVPVTGVSFAASGSVPMGNFHGDGVPMTNGVPVTGVSFSTVGSGFMGSGVGAGVPTFMRTHGNGNQGFNAGVGNGGAFSGLNRERLLRNFNQEIREDIGRLRVYRSLDGDLRSVVRRRRQRIDRLESLASSPDVVSTIRFLERMQLEDVEKGTRVLLMMRETEHKIGEKARFILSLRGVVVD